MQRYIFFHLQSLGFFLSFFVIFGVYRIKKELVTTAREEIFRF